MKNFNYTIEAIIKENTKFDKKYTRIKIKRKL